MRKDRRYFGGLFIAVKDQSQKALLEFIVDKLPANTEFQKPYSKRMD